MGDDSSKSIVNTLRSEWSLFWEAFQGEKPDVFEDGKLEVLDKNQIKEITKALLEDRKRINQKLESLSKEIDLNSAKLESLRLVGGEADVTLTRIHELHDLGQTMSDALSKLDNKLRNIREKENQLLEEMIS